MKEVIFSWKRNEGKGLASLELQYMARTMGRNCCTKHSWISKYSSILSAVMVLIDGWGHRVASWVGGDSWDRGKTSVVIAGSKQ